jgi:1-aminocyclopropane-1-carboxylate deaminase/D-cysteine desulfhydrase-like pyridoxal-dependent ACC family enzyme
MDKALPTAIFAQVDREQAFNLPRIALGTFPTPVERLDRIGVDNLWIKRDDLSSPVYGGNKVRKLEFILGHVKRCNKTHVVTLGGIGTNHGLATAIFCRTLALACTLVLFPQPVTSHVKQNLLLLKSAGARLKFRPSLMRAVLAFYLWQRLRHPGAYFLCAGGSNAVGTLGFVKAAFELKRQIDDGLLPSPAVIFCPVGSNGTLAGLTLGARLAGLASTVVGVRVSFSRCGPFQNCTPGMVKKLMAQTRNLLRAVFPDCGSVAIPEPVMWHQHLGDGYGFPTKRGEQAFRLLKDRQGILLDPTYTAKTFAAVLEYCRNHRNGPEPALYWHTYNSVDLTRQAQTVDYRELPKPLQSYILAREIDASQ